MAVFREVRRVLRDDGTLWLNYGDAYAGGGSPTCSPGLRVNKGGSRPREQWTQNPSQRIGAGKPKDLMMMPARVAMALQADGWWLRSEIIWHKPNPMPESVTDRPTSAHEKLFLLTPGKWVSRVVTFSNLTCQRFHFSEYFRPEGLTMRGSARLQVDLASAILNGAQCDDKVSLPPLHAEEWAQRQDGSDSDLVRGLPVEHRPAVWAARFLRSEASAEEFLSELQRFCVTHADGDYFLKRWALRAPSANSPGITSNREGTITVHYPGEVCKVDLGRHRVIISRPRSIPYFYDADAVRVPHLPVSLKRIESGLHHTHPADQGVGIPPVDTERMGERFAHAGGRNSRNVWTIPTHSFKEAHFATFPPALVEPCIQAGTSERGVCGECGAPWKRQVEQTSEYREYSQKDETWNRTGGEAKGRGVGRSYQATPTKNNTTGWASTCEHKAATVPATVLDPFAGSGTVGLVADRLQRDSVLIELSPEYAEMAGRRIKADAPLLANVVEGV